jgi:hypothetical protein
MIEFAKTKFTRTVFAWTDWEKPPSDEPCFYPKQHIVMLVFSALLPGMTRTESSEQGRGYCVLASGGCLICSYHLISKKCGVTQVPFCD